MNLTKEPVVRLANPHGDKEWTPEDADDRYRSNHVVLEQRHGPVGQPKVSFTTDRLDIGIYHDSFGINARSNVYFESGAYRQENARVYIPLEDHETLIAIRDLIQKALDQEANTCRAEKMR